MARGTPKLACPYCGRPLRWVPFRWFTRGSYQCDRCGDFPDLSHAPRTRPLEPPAVAVRVPTAHGDRPRVLLVDDSKEHRDLYALMLETTATVITAARGPDALAIAASASLDAIVLDVLMPGMDGWEVCTRLKANPVTRTIPVIMLTSLDSIESLEPARRSGAAAVLMKPCPIERLAAAIESVIAEHRSRPTGGSTAANRRWTRKAVNAEVIATASDRTAQVLNVSYGGLCLKVDAACHDMPPTLDVTFPAFDATVRVDVIWVDASAEGTCLCGAAVEAANEVWSELVDAIA